MADQSRTQAVLANAQELDLRRQKQIQNQTVSLNIILARLMTIHLALNLPGIMDEERLEKIRSAVVDPPGGLRFTAGLRREYAIGSVTVDDDGKVHVHLRPVDQPDACCDFAGTDECCVNHGA